MCLHSYCVHSLLVFNLVFGHHLLRLVVALQKSPQRAWHKCEVRRYFPFSRPWNDWSLTWHMVQRRSKKFDNSFIPLRFNKLSFSKTTMSTDHVPSQESSSRPMYQQTHHFRVGKVEFPHLMLRICKGGFIVATICSLSTILQRRRSFIMSFFKFEGNALYWH